MERKDCENIWHKKGNDCDRQGKSIAQGMTWRSPSRRSPSFKSPIFRSGSLLAPLQKSTSSRSLQRTLGFRVGSTSKYSQCPDLVRYSSDSYRIVALRRTSIGANATDAPQKIASPITGKSRYSKTRYIWQDAFASERVPSHVRSANAITHYGLVPGHSTGAPFAVLNFQQITMPYLAAFVSPDWTVVHIDEEVSPVDPTIAADLVGITFHTPSAFHAYDLAAQFRKRGIPVALGGPHVTLIPDEAQAHADVILLEEAESHWPEFLKDFEIGRHIRRYCSTIPPALNTAPMARKELYHRRDLTGGRLFATRGCPYGCDFCTLA